MGCGVYQTPKAVYNKENEKANVSTAWANLEFTVPSTGNNNIDAENSDTNDMSNKLIMEKGFVKVTYPCVDPKLMEFVDPAIE